MTSTVPVPARAWHPVASSSDLVPRHVYQGELHGRELAVWRADDGFVNVWENRCLHRGVRLSIAVSDGHELTCQYHGWRYSSRGAGCTYIPAHPADAPARTIANRTYPVAERHGLVWTTLDRDAPDDIPALGEAGCSPFPLRPLVVAAPSAAVADRLRGYGAAAGLRLAAAGELQLRFTGPAGLTLFVQPAGEGHCIIRGVHHGVPPEPARLGLLRRHHRLLTQIRDRVEAEYAGRPRTEYAPEFDPLPAALAAMPDRARPGRLASLRVRVARKWQAAAGVAGFELAGLTGDLPTAQPGAHIDVHLPNGEIRQYSVVNAPGDGGHYIIGVKREPQSRGGSACLHDTVREGDLLAVSEPRNNFPLRRDAELTILIAAGIGITPLLSMAQALQRHGRAHQLHYFAQSPAHLAFPERLATLGQAMQPHLGLARHETPARLREILRPGPAGRQVYVCGPGPIIEATRELATACGWPAENVHFEYFKNTTKIGLESTFDVALARSCLTLRVAPGQTILQAVRDAGVEVPSSCEQGACGTCIATVLEGDPVHQDVYLNAAEKAAGDTILTCVSRCSSPRLVLDL
jgi:ferredoxin-NADP reductase/nitrite reductase/ring-hydroxylating ferredoxin subunit